MKVIAMCNQKGGVGQSTLTRELGCYLAYSERKVLLVDGDGQANRPLGEAASSTR